MCRVRAEEEPEIHGLEQRVRYLTRMKEMADFEAKKMSLHTVVPPVRKTPVLQCAPIALLGRLALPPLKVEFHSRRKTEAGLEVIDSDV
jgi:hypothetical protein